jgi:dolichol-phosphate mannosyltransferase
MFHPDKGVTPQMLDSGPEPIKKELSFSRTCGVGDDRALSMCGHSERRPAAELPPGGTGGAAADPISQPYLSRAARMTRPPPDPHLLSAVVPVFNERDSLPQLLEELVTAADKLGRPLEVIFVDDGSTDDSWAVIRSLSTDDRVSGLRFRRNFGKAAALQAGFDRARGGVVFTLDADLQDDPAEMPKFLAKLDAGFDVVSGWKQVRHDPWHKVWPSRVFNRMVSRVTGVTLHDHNCGFKAYRAEVLREVRLYGERHRFVPVLAAAEGWKVAEVAVNHRPRKFGRSKFGARRFLKGFLDMLGVAFATEFGRRPLHALGTTAVLLLAVAAAFAGLAVAVGLFAPAGWLLLLPAGLAALLAGQAFFTGLAAELLLHRTPDTPYRVAETT